MRLATPIDRVLDALAATGAKPKRSGNGWECRCPAHEDSTPSLSVTAAEDGRALVHCHAGCSVDDVCAALGLTVRDLFDTPAVPDLATRASVPRGTSAPRREDKAGGDAPTSPAARTFATAQEAVSHLERQFGPRSSVWTYHTAEGEPVGLVVRWDTEAGKTIRPVSRSADGTGWRIGAMPTPRPLYALPQLAAADSETPVYVCEGEKAADAARVLGLVATTSQQGAKSAMKADWTALKGRDVVVLPDRDDPGEQYAAEVVERAQSAGARSVRVLRLESIWAEMPKGGDMADLVAERAGDMNALRDDIESAARTIEPVPAHSMRAPIRDHSARIEIVPVPISELGPAVPPDWIWPGYVARGHTTLLSGLWKAGKTTLLAHLVRDCSKGGGLVADPVDGRVLVVTEESASLWAGRRDQLGIGDRVDIVSRPMRARPSPDQWQDVVGQIAALTSQRRYALVIFDTVSRVWPVTQENDASEVGAALTPLYDITESGAAVLLIHHPRKGGGDQAQASRGSGALPGFVDVIVELGRFAPADPHDRRRVLNAWGRFDDTPPEAVIELTDDGYRKIGDVAHASRDDRWATIASILPSGGNGLTPDEVRAAWPTEHKPAKRSIGQDLSQGFGEGRWTRTGTGAKGKPYRYSRTP